MGHFSESNYCLPMANKNSSKLASIDLGFEATKPTKIVDKPLTSKPDPTSMARHPSEDLLCPIKHVPFFCADMTN